VTDLRAWIEHLTDAAFDNPQNNRREIIRGGEVTGWLTRGVTMKPISFAVKCALHGGIRTMRYPWKSGQIRPL
jgi:hypothetical protein